MRLRTFGGLWIENPSSGVKAGPRPRPLALLAILATAGAKGVSRDRVLGILWPESDPERARHALSQTIYSLRRDLGVEVVLSTPDLRLDAQLISSDVDDFRAAIAEKNWARAAELYVGPFLDGFYLGDAPEFERWVEEERSSLATQGIRAIELLAMHSGTSGCPEEACELWRRLTRLDPFSARFATSYMEALGTLGDRSTALAHGKLYTELMRKELEAEPDRSVQRLLIKLRDAPHTDETRVPPRPVPVATTIRSEDSGASQPVPDQAAARLAIHRRPAVRLAAGIIVIVAIAPFASRAITAAHAPARPVLAVGRIQDLVAPDSAAPSRVLSEMLSTSLARLNDLQVIANSRMLELTPRDAELSPGVLTDAARRAGATEIVEGELVPLPDRQLRLEVRRVDVARGLVRGGYRVSGSDRITLFDSVTSLIAADLRLGAPTASLAEVSTLSPIAYRLYEEGLRAFYQFDVHTANRLFRAAVREDSAFAMATYYAWRSAVAIGDPAQRALAERALALASRAPPRDRLLIVTHVDLVRNDLAALAAADSLAGKYPRDPEALLRAAEVVPDLRRSIDLLNRAIALDSAAAANPSGVCRLCDAFSLLAARYSSVDSMDAVERTLTRWRTIRASDPMPWHALAEHLLSLGRRREADLAERRYLAMGAVRGDPVVQTLDWNLRSDDLDAVNTQCDQALTTRDTTEFLRYRWLCTIGLRMQGRYKEALALIHEGRLPRTTIVRRGMPPDPYHTALLDMEMGRGMIAADEFLALDNAASDTTQLDRGARVSQSAWILTLGATAAVEGGDTIRARSLVDSIESLGRRSLYGRDPRLHHFVRGLLFSRAQQLVSATREFRAALHSVTNGYTRINYELGRASLAMNRPTDAIAIVRAPLRGRIEGPSTYLTRTEVHELLAQLFDAAGQRDSADAHYAVVERAWRSADPALRPRYDAARQRLARTGRLPAH